MDETKINNKALTLWIGDIMIAQCDNDNYYQHKHCYRSLIELDTYKEGEGFIAYC